MVKCLACGGMVSTRNRETCPNCGLAFTEQQKRPIDADLISKMHAYGMITVDQVREHLGLVEPPKRLSVNQVLEVQAALNDIKYGVSYHDETEKVTVHELYPMNYKEPRSLLRLRRR